MFFKILHCVNEHLYAFHRHGVVDRCAEATYRAVSLDAYDAAFACELKEFLVELGILWTEYEADVHD